MIVGFVGVPGSGKTYEAVKKIVFNLKKRRHVYTNIDGMDVDIQQEFMKNLVGMDDYEFDKYFHFLSRDDVQQFWTIARHGSLIVLDEIHKTFNCRDWQSKKNNAFADWASTHRHYGYDLILITQDMDKVEKQVRSLLEWTYVFRKVNFLGSAVKKRYLAYSYSGDETHGKPLSTQTRTYQEQYFRCYKSYAADDAKEVGFMKHVNVLKHPVFFALPVVLVAAIWMLFSKSSLASGDLFGHKKIVAGHQKVIDNMRKKTGVQVDPAHKVAAGRPALSPPVQQPLSSAYSSLPQENPKPEWRQYRIDGYVKGDGKTVVLVNGVRIRLPNFYLRKVNLAMKTCEGLYEVFGDVQQKTFVTYAPAAVPDVQP